jgi:hypothetical protein
LGQLNSSLYLFCLAGLTKVVLLFGADRTIFDLFVVSRTSSIYYGGNVKKNPWVAAILNFFLFGAGTLYIGKRMFPGLLITLGGSWAQFIEIKMSPPLDNYPIWPYLFAGFVLLKIGLAIDGYREAQLVS